MTLQYLHLFDPAKCGGHEKRYALSLEWIVPLENAQNFDDDPCPNIIIDFGQNIDEAPFDLALHQLLPVLVRSTGKQDLRYPTNLADNNYAGVCAMEILEHMKDRVEDRIDEMCYSGIRNLLAEAFRILRPGGWMFLSTPNLSQYGCAWRLIRGDAANWNLCHAREFGFLELQQFVAEAGFSIERIAAVNVWDPLPCPGELAVLMDRLCPAVPHDGDCIFLIARKPEGSP